MRALAVQANAAVAKVCPQQQRFLSVLTNVLPFLAGVKYQRPVCHILPSSVCWPIGRRDAVPNEGLTACS